ncbi:MAG TPA: beta-propeller fold lactonase family protein [Edaphobacter sp.]|uniref:lactonase family protein n=1 Tax=Edaphobacter sp. TaxID=1934404 RepID=UPI002BFC9EAF|nr:beta-propeller fold lactonase family protein [Edaphobacter sp.]HUZ93432.1 beta-propeller fold lactonase family protein [Edaphobacter sp.]
MNDFTANEAALHQDSLIGNSETSCAPIDSRVNRRTFLTGMGLGGAVLALSPFHLPSVFESRAEDLMLCMGSFGAADAGTLHLLQIQREESRVLYTHPSARPSAIVRHPFRSLLYVANDVSLYRHQPRGTVETFALDPATGTLELVGRQPLSLSATRPRSLAISPDGRSLLVAAFGGGAYNVLTIDKSGLPAVPSGILKQVGQGKHPTEQSSAHPSHVVFHPGTGTAIAADYGAERLDILASDCGEFGVGNMKVAARIPCAVGSGPSKIAIHPDGELFVVAHILRPALAAFRLAPEMKLVPVGHASLHDAPTAICFSSGRNIVFAAQTRGTRQALLTAWTIDPQKGTLQRAAEITLPAGEVASIHPAGSTLWLASDRGMIAVELDRHTGVPREAYRVSSLPNLRSMALI